jgi:hypothetical protein
LRAVYPWLFVDNTNNIWKFSLNQSNELSYKIMYEEGKWTKKSLVAVDVLCFAIYIDEEWNIHIIYSTSSGDLLYCTMKDKQWVGTRLYHIKSDEFEIRDLRIELLDGQMHIFYILADNDGSDHGVLSHCIWNGKDTIVNTLSDVILVPDAAKYYAIYINGSNLEMFFITDEGDEAGVNHCTFKKGRWGAPERLYGIKGTDISFEVLGNQQGIHILNKSKEYSSYFLESVYIDVNQYIRKFSVYESSSNIEEPSLIIHDNKFYACWLKSGAIYYSSFSGDKWDEPVPAENVSISPLKGYDCFMNYGTGLRAGRVYGTDEPDMHLFVPDQFIEDGPYSLDASEHQTSQLMQRDGNDIEIIKEELIRAKTLNSTLEKTLASLNMQLQSKQRLLKEYEENITKITEQKIKMEENCNIFLEVNQNIAKELEKIKQQLSSEETLNVNLKEQLAQKEKEVEQLKEQIEVKNQSFMDRLLKKKNGGI